MFKEKEVKIDVQDVSKIYYSHKNRWSQVKEHLGLPFNKESIAETAVLKNFNLTIKSGERLGVIGRNGAGKSTLLKIIAGLVRATEGQIVINGQISALFDVTTGFHVDFTGRQNVISSLAYYGITGKKADSLLEEIIDFSELHDAIDQPYKNYSAGMQSRLAFSVATLQKPDILIIDEVLGAGDAYFAAKCMERMNEITMNGATVILVSHSLSAILQFSNRAIWIDRGKIQAEGRPFDVVDEYQKSVQHYEELRLIAKSARINMKLHPSVATGTYGQYIMLRFRVSSAKSPRALGIDEIELLINKKSNFSLDIGAPLDDDPSYPMFLPLDGNKAHWSSSENVDGHDLRFLVKGKDPQNACLMVMLPLNLSNEDLVQLKLGLYLRERLTLIVECLNRASSKFDVFSSTELVGNGFQDLLLTLPAWTYLATTEIEKEKPKDVVGNNQVSIESKPEKNKLKFIENTTTVSKGIEGEPKNVEESDGKVVVNDGKDLDMVHKIMSLYPKDKGPIFILDCYLLKDDKRTFSYSPKDTFRLVIEYYSSRKVIAPKFVVNILRIDGIRMRQSISDCDDGYDFSEICKGKGKVYCDMTPFYFAPGNYVINVGVFEEVDLTNSIGMSSPMSLRSNIVEFQVLGQEGVLVDMGCMWTPVTWLKA